MISWIAASAVATAIGVQGTFNNDTAANYALRKSADDAADTTGTSAANFDVTGSSAGTTNLRGIFFIVNISSSVKLLVGYAVNGTLSLGSRYEFSAKWVNTASQITRLDLTNVGAGSYDGGDSKIEIYGSN